MKLTEAAGNGAPWKTRAGAMMRASIPCDVLDVSVRSSGRSRANGQWQSAQYPANL